MYGMGVAVGDYDNDGYDDLFITALGQSHLFHNNGNGTFTEVTQAPGIWGPNEFSTERRLGRLRQRRQTRSGRRELRAMVPAERYLLHARWTHKSYCTPESYKGTSARLWHNLGNGKFEDATQKAGLLRSDFQEPRHRRSRLRRRRLARIFVANDTQPNKLYREQRQRHVHGKGVTAGIAFSEDGVARAGMGVDAADYDRSGQPSI